MYLAYPIEGKFLAPISYTKKSCKSALSQVVNVRRIYAFYHNV